MKTFAQQLDECVEYALQQMPPGSGVAQFMAILLRGANMPAARARYIAAELERREQQRSQAEKT